MLSNATSGARSELIGGLKNGKDIFDLISVVLNLGQDSIRNGFFAHLHRSDTKSLFNYTKKTKGLL